MVEQLPDVFAPAREHVAQPGLCFVPLQKAARHFVGGGATTLGVYVQKTDLGRPRSEWLTIIDSRGDPVICSCRGLRNRRRMPSLVRDHTASRFLFLAERVRGRTQIASKKTPVPWVKQEQTPLAIEQEQFEAGDRQGANTYENPDLPHGLAHLFTPGA
jgi:hypothetical protein